MRKVNMFELGHDGRLIDLNYKGLSPRQALNVLSSNLPLGAEVISSEISTKVEGLQCQYLIVTIEYHWPPSFCVFGDGNAADLVKRIQTWESQNRGKIAIDEYQFKSFASANGGINLFCAITYRHVDKKPKID